MPRAVFSVLKQVPVVPWTIQVAMQVVDQNQKEKTNSPFIRTVDQKPTELSITPTVHCRSRSSTDHTPLHHSKVHPPPTI